MFSTGENPKRKLIESAQMVVSRRGGRRHSLLLCRSRGVSPLFELKVELRTFNSQKNTSNAIFNTVSMFETPRYCPTFYSNVAKINSTRHSLGVSVAKNTKCRII